MFQSIPWSRTYQVARNHAENWESQRDSNRQLKFASETNEGW
jgi:hypothetical protein